MLYDVCCVLSGARSGTCLRRRFTTRRSETSSRGPPTWQRQTSCSRHTNRSPHIVGVEHGDKLNGCCTQSLRRMLYQSNGIIVSEWRRTCCWYFIVYYGMGNTCVRDVRNVLTVVATKAGMWECIYMNVQRTLWIVRPYDWLATTSASPRHKRFATRRTLINYF